MKLGDGWRKLILRFKDGKLDGKSAKQVFEKNTLKVNYNYNKGIVIDSIIHKFNPDFQGLFIHRNGSPNKHLFRKQSDSIQSIYLCVYENVGGKVSISKNIKIIRFSWEFGCQGLDLETQENNCYFKNFRWNMFRKYMDCKSIGVGNIVLEDEYGNQWIDNGFGIRFE